ncbi:MAG: hypothetical protein KDE47_07810, partial [Caldilineaceae bacterium]|nr:hypothetical protein [Caldilineaceae bacterium]
VGVAVGVADGVAGGVAVGVTFFRIPRTPFWVLWTLWQWWRARQQTSYAKRAFSQSVIEKDELIYLPLPGFNRFLARCLTAQTDHQAAIEMLTTTARSTGQKWAVPYASTHWVANLAQQAENLSAFGPLAGQFDGVADILQTLPRKSEEIANLLRDFAAIAYSLAHVQEAHSLSVAHRVLERNRSELDTLRVRAETLKNPQLAQVAVHWQRLIRTHAEQLEQLPREVLAGAYQAGSALETNSTLFRGRKELFALTSEVYANPNRAETLLLVAQQRMGKSSALMQLPAQLPDAHVVIVDCQRAISGSGDDLFAIGLSSAIYNEEKRRPGGVRLQPLTEETVGKHPLLRLNKWLEQYADKVRGKRVLLCLDEFDKLVKRVSEGKLSQDVLGVLRGLSQAPGWMVLYSGQYELDNWSMEFAEYIKNVRRVRVSYLKPDEAHSLLADPVPDFALTWEEDAIERALFLSGCQPYLLQMIGVQVVNRLTPTDRRIVSAADVDELAPHLFDEGRYYFQSLYKLFDDDEKKALLEIATTGQTPVNDRIIRRLVDREYLVASGDGGWQFCVPLLRDWFKQSADFVD